MSALRPTSRKNLCLCAIAFGFLIGLLALTQSVSADPSPNPASIDTLQQMQEQIDQQRSNLRKERDRISDTERAAESQLGDIELNIQSTDTAYQDYEAQIQLANQRLKALQVELFAAESTYYQKQAAIIARLRFLQRQQRTGFGWDILLDSENLNEFLDRRRRVKLVYQADQQILASLKVASDRIKQKKTEVEQQKNQIALLTQQLLAQKAQYQAQQAAQQQLIERLKTNKQALEAAQIQLAVDSRNIGNLIRRQIAAERKARFPNTLIYGTGELIFPSEGEISSGFGWRQHPILGHLRFHAGIDFAGSYGSPIQAADRGTVILAGWYGGYGNTVIIDHGDGIATLYGHTSKLYVSEGQSVQLGQAIAAVGSSGLSTGPHLHFEVRKNGEPVDPMNYL